jgi:hypothetical protein
MINTDFIIETLTSILHDCRQPVMSGKYSASRDDSLATGTSGIALALIELESLSANQVRASKPLNDIFSSTLVEITPDCNAYELFNDAEEVGTTMGDLFSGFACATWTRLTVHQPQTLALYTEGPGSVVRPGLGHGELVREFTRWLHGNSDHSQEFTPSEMQFQSHGWCNGTSGLLCTKAIAAAFRRESSDEISELRYLASGLLNQSLSSLAYLGPTLCHGLPGLLVVCAGIARMLNDPDLQRTTNSIFEAVDWDDLITHIPADTYTDASWLTGTAGVLWAKSVIQKTPLVNPLLPIDSKFYQDEPFVS